MPKKRPDKFGNDLDIRQKPLQQPSQLDSDKEWEAYFTARHDLQVQTMYSLMQHYGVELNDNRAWEKLAWKLALQFVPAMQFEEKRGQPKKWNWRKYLGLYCLVHLCEIDHPETSKKEIFINIPKTAQNTILQTLIPADADCRNIENIYYEFLKSDQGRVLLKLIHQITPDEKKILFLRQYLSGEIDSEVLSSLYI